MSHKFRLSNLVLLTTLFFAPSIAAQPFPENFHMIYELRQEDKSVGKMLVEYKSKNSKYELKAVTEGDGILRLLGNRDLNSKGKITNSGFFPNVFEVKNIKKPNKNILAIFNSLSKKIEIKYNNEISTLDLGVQDLDLAIYLYQFNFEKTDQGIYKFNVLEGKKRREYEYKKVRDEAIQMEKTTLLTEMYEGKIISKENSTHYVWISKGKYRVPVKLRVSTDFGLLMDQVMVKTNLAL